jgi:hypothetical protein
MTMMTNKNAENAMSFICDKCDFRCSKKSNYNKHITTLKHKMNYNIYEKMPKMPKKNICVCGKEYVYRQGLSSHRKNCKPIVNEEKSVDDIKILTNLVFELVKSNSDLHKQMMEVCKTSNMSITHNNSHNKTFNLQVFLNEQCKDAMNIMDFVDSMTLEFADLEDVGKLGYVEGISNIIIRKLNEMDVYKRPIHCSDAKREIMYVKDDDIWEKENSTYDKLRKAIKYITKKNGDLMLPWSQENPLCMNTSHPLNDIYIQIMNQSMGGKESFVESENKIMRKIAKVVLIEK